MEIKVVRRVLDVNEKMADQNRKMFAEKGVFVLNVMLRLPGCCRVCLHNATVEP